MESGNIQRTMQRASSRPGNTATSNLMTPTTTSLHSNATTSPARGIREKRGWSILDQSLGGGKIWRKEEEKPQISETPKGLASRDTTKINISGFFDMSVPSSETKPDPSGHQGLDATSLKNWVHAYEQTPHKLSSTSAPAPTSILMPMPPPAPPLLSTDPVQRSSLSSFAHQHEAAAFETKNLQPGNTIQAARRTTASTQERADIAGAGGRSSNVGGRGGGGAVRHGEPGSKSRAKWKSAAKKIKMVDNAVSRFNSESKQVNSAASPLSILRVKDKARPAYRSEVKAKAQVGSTKKMGSGNKPEHSNGPGIYPAGNRFDRRPARNQSNSRTTGGSQPRPPTLEMAESLSNGKHAQPRPPTLVMAESLSNGKHAQCP